MRNARISLTEAYSETLLGLMKHDSRVVALDADVAKRMGTRILDEEFPERHINVGIAEQNLIGVAAGLAAVGKVPFAGTFAIFITGRSWEQLRQVVAYPKLNVKVIGAHGGISVGEDGATHQAYEDIALARVLPNFNVIVPCDPLETRQATILALQTEGPVYIRLARPPLPNLVPAGYELSLGKAGILRAGTDVTIAACGIMVERALIAAELLDKEGISSRVLNMSSIKPIDREAIIAAAEETAGIITVEDHSIIGGLGSAVAEIIAETGRGRMSRVGIPDCFGESGDHESLLSKYGLATTDIVVQARTLIEES